MKRSIGVCVGASAIKIVELLHENSDFQIGRTVVRNHACDPEKTFSREISKFGLPACDYICVTGRKFKDMIHLPVITEPEAIEYALKHLIMPGFALSLGPMAQEARITRSSMTENLQRDFIALERSQAIPERRIMSRYLMRISIIPTVSVLGLDFASQLGWAFLVELIFNWPGLSRYGINVMLHKDLNAIVAVIMIIGLMFLVVNIIVDVIVGGLDPRIRLGAERSK